MAKKGKGFRAGRDIAMMIDLICPYFHPFTSFSLFENWTAVINDIYNRLIVNTFDTYYELRFIDSLNIDYRELIK